jgi:DNA invertase Pin-like site-specific DNA recombinase
MLINGHLSKQRCWSNASGYPAFLAPFPSVAVQKLLPSMPSAVYQFERNIMLERQREGIAIAKAKGRYKGRPKSIDRGEILTLLDDGLSMRKTADRLGVSLSTAQ